MELFTIKEQVQPYIQSVYGNQDLSIDIRMIKLLTKEQKKYHEHIIYLGSTEMLPQPDTTGRFIYMCFGEVPQWTQYRNSSFLVLLIKNEFDPFVIFNHIQDLLQDNQLNNTGLHMLINAFFTEQGLQYITDVAYQVFGNPLFVVDNRHKYLAVSSGIAASNVFASEETKGGHINEEGISFIRSERIDQQIRSQKAPVYFLNPLHGTGMLVDAITINNIEVGHVMLYELDRPFSEFDSILLNRTSRIISMELQKNSFITANKGFMYSYFLADLIDNPDMNVADVEKRLALLGYDLREDQYMLVIPARSYRNSGTNLNIIVEQLHQLLTGSIYAIYQDTIAILISRSRKDGIGEYEYNRLVDFLSTNNLSAGMSNFFNSLKDSRRFYQQALKSYELGQRLGIEEVIHHYSDYYLYHIFEMGEKEEDLRFFIHPGMMKLLQYDQKHGTDFLGTLYTFLETPGQPTKISRRLHIHKNTLLYRMEKIRTIMGSKVEAGDEFMSFGLSYKLMKYLKII